MAEAKKPAPQAEPADSGKGKKNTILYIVIGLLVLALVAVTVIGGIVYLNFQAEKANGDTVASADHDGDKSKEKKEAKKEKSDEPPVFEKLDTFTVNLQGGTVLQTEIDVRLSSEKQKDVIKNFLPRISSQVNLLLGSKKPEDIATTEGKLKLMGELKQSINKALGAKTDEEGVMEVEFKTFIVQ